MWVFYPFLYPLLAHYFDICVISIIIFKKNIATEIYFYLLPI